MAIVYTITEINCLMIGICYVLVQPFSYLYLWYQVL